MNDNSSYKVYKNYLYDLGPLFLERALDAKAQTKKGETEGDQLFQTGRLIAFHEVISIMQQQAESFGIPLKDLRLEDVVPERDLV